MTNTKSILAFVASSLLIFGSCNDDADPVIENEEELITTARLTLVHDTESIVAEWKDIDGDGANPPVIDDISLAAGTTYEVSLELLNESTTPVGNISVEIKEEGTAHQFFFVTAESLDLTTSYNDQDEDGNPIGLESTFVTGAASTGSLSIVLRHQADKNAAGVSDGEIENAGGETDIETIPAFTVTIQ